MLGQGILVPLKGALVIANLATDHEAVLFAGGSHEGHGKLILHESLVEPLPERTVFLPVPERLLLFWKQSLAHRLPNRFQTLAIGTP